MKNEKPGRSNATKTEKAYEALKRAILRGEIPEGEFLSEAEIVHRYNLGRTPYREACNRLHHDGLLEVVPRRGYLVPELSFHTVRDIFEVRLILEGHIAELAALRGTDEEIAELEARSRKAKSPAQDSAFETQIRANAEFHLHLARMSRNRELLKLLNWNLEQTERLMYLELRSTRAQPNQALLLHGPIIAALRKRNPDAVREAVLADIVDAQRNTLARLTEFSSSKFSRLKEVSTA